jgi:beta-lactamase class A
MNEIEKNNSDNHGKTFGDEPQPEVTCKHPVPVVKFFLENDPLGIILGALMICIALVGVLLVFASSHQAESKQRALLKSNITILINERITQHKIIDASVYIIDLRSKKTLGFHEDEKYAPASLLKVSILLAYLKQMEVNPHLKSSVLRNNIGPHATIPQYFHHKEKLTPDTLYTVEDLANRMILYSDNQAMSLLFGLLGKDVLSKTISDLGITMSYVNGKELISPKEYATFFLTLYDATYVNKDMSQDALALLTKSDFTRGLVAGVPSSIIVAHKYGEREEGDIKQLHDCGIIYFPQSPYLLCVMTKGTDMKNLTETIKVVSHMVYEEKVSDNQQMSYK